MILFKKRISVFVLVVIISCISLNAWAQATGSIQISGKIKKDNKAVGGATIQVSGAGVTPQTITSKENGSFTFTLELQKNYSITFSKMGLVPKMVEFNTKLPPDQADIIYQFPFDIDLIENLGGVSNNDAMTKPVAKISYNITYEDFMHDENYTRQIKAEQDAARKQAEEIHRQQERVRLDSLNKIWNDSLAKVKSREGELMAIKAEQDRLNKEREKARQDSISRANAAAQEASASAAREKARLDMIAIAEANAKALAESYERHRQDSINKAEAERSRLELQRAARMKASQDSLDRVIAERNRQDSLTAVREAAAAQAKLEADKKAIEKARIDSLNQAEAAQKARQKFIADSISAAQFESKKAEEEAKRIEKARQDSVTKALAMEKEKQKALEVSAAAALASQKAREKFVADSTAEAKVQQDKKAKEEKARSDEEARIKEKQQAELALAVSIALKERQKFTADSTQKANAEAKSRKEQEEQLRIKRQQDSLALMKEEELRKSKTAEENRLREAFLIKEHQDSINRAEAAQKQKAEEDRQLKIAQEKATQDSIFIAQRALKEKEEEEKNAKVLAEIEAQKLLLAKSNKVEEKATTTPKQVAAVPKIRDSDYRDGVTEETINEANRVIYRTVVKKEGIAYNYQKIVYNWGGVFYFKNDNSITEITFNQEIKNAKEILK